MRDSGSGGICIKEIGVKKARLLVLIGVREHCFSLSISIRIWLRIAKIGRNGHGIYRSTPVTAGPGGIFQGRLQNP